MTTVKIHLCRDEEKLLLRWAELMRRRHQMPEMELAHLIAACAVCSARELLKDLESP